MNVLHRCTYTGHEQADDARAGCCDSAWCLDAGRRVNSLISTERPGSIFDAESHSWVHIPQKAFLK